MCSFVYSKDFLNEVYKILLLYVIMFYMQPLVAKKNFEVGSIYV